MGLSAGGDDAGSVETGTYDGDGSSSGREITLGYEPDFFVLMRSSTDTAAKYEGFKEGVNAAHNVTGGTLTTTIEMTTEVHTSSGGITVGDGGTNGNVDNETYVYAAWRDL